MKFVLAVGGFVGFALVGVTGILVGRDPARTLLEACVAAIIVAMLCRWLHRLFVSSVNEAMEERRKAQIIESTEAAMKQAAAVSAAAKQTMPGQPRAT